ncbi:MAG: hypothetical protein PVJ80_14840 [Gemmatimonadota bacterium]|jgi:hypothetical protein
MKITRSTTFRFLLCVAGLSLASACDRPTPTGPQYEARLSQRSNFEIQPGEVVPFRMSGTGVFVGQEFAPGFGPPEFGKSDFGGRCSTPADYLVQFMVTAEALHLGTVVAEMEHCGHIDFQSGFTNDRDGLMTIHAADGDELSMAYEGTSVAGEFEGVTTFEGGTGRFTDASGGGTLVGVADRSTGTLPLVEVEGVIAYEAADAAR